MRCVVNENFTVFHGHSPVKLEAGQVVSGSLAQLLLRSAAKKVTAIEDEAPAAEDGDPEVPPPPPPPGPDAELDIEAPISDVLAWVGEDPGRAAEALGQEQAKGAPRSTLVKQLEKLAAS
ncbi:hypothetical protein [Streptomyces sp. NBC_00035]|uniref:hypothetical protein n=1 Tax=Streptomyces sp. NBC_00035 TaxID=2903614 RepID=UPI00325060CF